MSVRELAQNNTNLTTLSTTLHNKAENTIASPGIKIRMLQNGDKHQSTTYNKTKNSIITIGFEKIHETEIH